MKGRARKRFHPDDPNATAKPRRNAADQAATTNRHHDRVHIGYLALKFHREGPRTGKDLGLIIGMHHQGTGEGGPRLHRQIRFREPLADDRYVGTVGNKTSHLGGRGNFRNVDLSSEPKGQRGKGNGCPVIATRCGNDT